MLLQSITLKNIRSYVDQKIAFPSGTVLLAGDIGSGKSTILLAIEFALFGLLRGDVDGASLLRNGAREGIVELKFLLDKEYVIQRVLKRGKDRVSQEAGWLLSDGMRKDGTAQELRAWMLDLLGYPKEFLTKSKALLFRYTVFTPQEEMKRILFEDKDARLETLRRVFDVDKYKRIKENAQIYVRQLKQERSLLEGITIDLESKRNAVKLKQEESLSIKARVSTSASQLADAKSRTAAQREIVTAKEVALKDFQRIKTEWSVAKATLAQQEQALVRVQQDLQRANEQIALLTQELSSASTADVESLRKSIAEKSESLQLAEKTIREEHGTIIKLMTEKSFSTELKRKVAAIDNCPTCFQPVRQTHKDTIFSTEDQKLQGYEQHLQAHTAAKEQWETQLLTLRKDIDALRLQERQAMLIQAQRKTLQDKQSSLDQLSKTRAQTNESIIVTKNSIAELTLLVEGNLQAEDQWKLSRQQYDVLLNDERRIELEHARFAKEHENTELFIRSLQEDIVKKELAKSQLTTIAERQSWLSVHFTNLMDVMEKHVLSRVYHEFNELFQRWFGILIEDGLLTARLDDAFTPVITQNGYDIDVSNLSGGEKTACALAYRLALNKVINDVVGTIRTKQLLILDEPTDGFSSEQLDKVRDVLDQLQLKQVIIVSHENKVESMVDSVIRIEKEGHISKSVS